MLLLEDDPALLDVLRLAIEGWGHRVLAAGGASEAVRLAGEERRVDLLLADLGVLRRDGGDLVAEVRAVHPELRPVYMSGAGRDDDVPRAPSPAAGPFLAKPFPLRLLEDAFRDALGVTPRARRG